jgi:hypothetical protein
MSVTVTGQQAGAAAARDLEVLQLRPNFFMIAGAGGNIGVQIGEDGVVVVDAGAAASANAVVAAIKKLTPQPIRYIIDTSADPDHVGGNETVSKAGQTLFTAPGAIGITGDFLGGVASILSAQKVLERMSAPTGRASPYPVAAMPTRPLTTRGNTCTSTARASRCCTSPPRTPTATSSSSSAVPTSSWPATSWIRTAFR